MKPERVRPIGRARREDSGERPALVVARVHLENVASSLVEPRDDDELVAYVDPPERVRDGRFQFDRRIRCSFVALAGRRCAVLQRRSDEADRIHQVPVEAHRLAQLRHAQTGCGTRPGPPRRQGLRAERVPGRMRVRHGWSMWWSSGRLCPIPSAEVTQHRNADLGARLRLHDHEGRVHELRHVARVPLEVALLVRSRLRDAAELGQQAVTRVGFEQPCERSTFLRVGLAVQLERRYREPSVDEILGAS